LRKTQVKRRVTGNPKGYLLHRNENLKQYYKHIDPYTYSDLLVYHIRLFMPLVRSRLWVSRDRVFLLYRCPYGKYR